MSYGVTFSPRGWTKQLRGPDVLGHSADQPVGAAERCAAPEYEPKRRRIDRGDRGKCFDDMEILFDQRRAWQPEIRLNLAVLHDIGHRGVFVRKPVDGVRPVAEIDARVGARTAGDVKDRLELVVMIDRRIELSSPALRLGGVARLGQRRDSVRPQWHVRERVRRHGCRVSGRRRIRMRLGRCIATLHARPRTHPQTHKR
jgi:hypothetical protein